MNYQKYNKTLTKNEQFFYVNSHRNSLQGVANRGVGDVGGN